MAEIMVVFDFDKTIIEVDSDNWVVERRHRFVQPIGFHNALEFSNGKFDRDRMMNELHALGNTVDGIKEVLRRVLVHPRIVPAIKTAHALGCDLRIVSDANMLFVETILNHLGIRNCFSEINTDPSYVDEEGKLRISPYVDFHSCPHGCTNPCPPNMCKGLIIENIQVSLVNEGKKRMIYIGDGAGDFCPSLKLKEGDFMMPRKNFPIWDLICKNHKCLRAKTHEWVDGGELEHALLTLIEKISIEETINSNPAQLLSVDCKSNTIAVAAQEALPLPHKVHQ